MNLYLPYTVIPAYTTRLLLIIRIFFFDLQPERLPKTPMSESLAAGKKGDGKKVGKTTCRHQFFNRV